MTFVTPVPRARPVRMALLAVSAFCAVAVTVSSLPGQVSSAASPRAGVEVIGLDALTAPVWEDRPVRVTGTVTVPSTPTPLPTPSPSSSGTPTSPSSPSSPTSPVSPSSPATGSTPQPNQPAGAAPVQLWSRPVRGGTWSPIGSPAPVSAAGRFTATLTWPAPGAVLVQARRGQVASSPLTVTVGDRRVSLAPRPARSRVLADRQVATGTVVPAEPNVAVSVTWTLPRGGRRSARVLTGRDGRWTHRLPETHRTGRLTVRASSGRGAALEQTSVRSTRLRAAFVVTSRPVTRSMVQHSYRPGCPVGPEQLVALRMIHRAYDGSYRWGDLVVARTAQRQITAAFRKGFTTGFRIRKMRTAEHYRGSDPAAMADNNTSAFNCRRVTGDPFSLSPHSYGTAVDINTVQNPYRDVRGRWWPRRNAWTDRSKRHPGMIRSETPLRREFARHGFVWGGHWSNPDWQHFDPRRALRPRRAARVPALWEKPVPASALPPTLPGGFRPDVVDQDGHAHLTPSQHTRPRSVRATTDALQMLCGPLPARVRIEAAVQRSYRSPGNSTSADRTAQALVVRTGATEQTRELVAALRECRPHDTVLSVTARTTRQVLVVARGV